MAQATYVSQGSHVDYTPGSAVTAGAVVVVGLTPLVAAIDIAASALGSLCTDGVFDVAKDASAFVAGDVVYWNPTGDPNGGTAGTGAATSTAAGAYLMGVVPPAGAALTGATTVRVQLGASPVSKVPRLPTRTVAAAGSTQADAAALYEGFNLVTAADATKGVLLPAAVAGMQVIVKNGDAANAILKIWPATGDGVNAVAVNSAFSIAAKTSVLLVAYDATTWYSVPLLPS